MNTSNQEIEFEEIEFEPLEEKWNKYVLRDGTIIRGRIIILKILGPKGKTRYVTHGARLDVKTQNIFVVSAPPALRGPPGRPLSQEEIQQLASKGQPIEIVDPYEPWNIYRIVNTGETFKLKLVVSEIIRIPDHFDPEGQSIYVIVNTAAFAPGSGHPLPTA